MGEKRPKRPVKSTQTLFRIVEALEAHDGARVTELANELGLAKSTVHQQLSTLLDLGYVTKEDGEYHVGLRFLYLGEYARTRKEAYQLAKPLVEELARETGERAQFLVEEGGRAVYLYIEQGEHAVQTDRRIGKQRYLHSSASGKAILANMHEEEVEEVIDTWGLPAETDDTITTPEGLFENLEEIRERGYSLNIGESIDGLRAIGVPVMYPDGSVLGSFSIAGPSYRLQGERFEHTIPDLLLGTANELELKIAYP
jgi:DNA-binding IclR family transcriptional regulator